jgi:transposase
MGKQTRRTFDQEFKRNTVKMIIDGRRKAEEIARDLNVVPSLIYKWKREYLKDEVNAFPGEGKLKPEDDEIRRLKRKLQEAEEERDILKKAIAIFSVKKTQN